MCVCTNVRIQDAFFYLIEWWFLFLSMEQSYGDMKK